MFGKCKQSDKPTHHIPHSGGAEEIDTDVVRPLQMINSRAIVANTRAIKDVVSRINQADFIRPVPDLLSPFIIGGIAGVFAWQIR